MLFPWPRLYQNVIYLLQLLRYTPPIFFAQDRLPFLVTFLKHQNNKYPTYQWVSMLQVVSKATKKLIVSSVFTGEALVIKMLQKILQCLLVPCISVHKSRTTDYKKEMTSSFLFRRSLKKILKKS